VPRGKMLFKHPQLPQNRNEKALGRHFRQLKAVLQYKNLPKCINVQAKDTNSFYRLGRGKRDLEKKK